MPYSLRKANTADNPAIEKLIDASVRGLQAQDYTPEQIDAALRTVFTVDTQLIEDGTYFVVEQDGEMIGCGGWSQRKTLCGGDHHAVRENALMDPSRGCRKDSRDLCRAAVGAPRYWKHSAESGRRRCHGRWLSAVGNGRHADRRACIFAARIPQS